MGDVIPAFWDDQTLATFTYYTKGVLKYGMPLILIVVALIIAEAVSGGILDMINKARNAKDEDDDDDDDYEVYHYKKR